MSKITVFFGAIISIMDVAASKSETERIREKESLF